MDFSITAFAFLKVYRLLVISDVRFSRVLGLAFLSFIFTGFDRSGQWY